MADWRQLLKMPSFPGNPYSPEESDTPPPALPPINNSDLTIPEFPKSPYMTLDDGTPSFETTPDSPLTAPTIDQLAAVSEEQGTPSFKDIISKIKPSDELEQQVSSTIKENEEWSRKSPYERFIDIKLKQQEDLQKAQDERDSAIKNINVAEALGGFADATSRRYGGSPGSSDFWDKLRQQAALKPKELSEKQQKEDALKSGFLKESETEVALSDLKKQADPNSQLSKFARMVAEQRGIQVENEASYDDLAPILKLAEAAGIGKQRDKSYYPVPTYAEDGSTKMVFVNTKDPTDVVDPQLSRAYAPRLTKDPRTGETMAYLSPGREMQAVTAPATIEQTQDKTAQPEITLQNLNDAQIKQLTNARKDFNSEIKKIKEASDAAQTIKEVLTAGKELKGDVKRNIQTSFARLSGEVGAMTENDVAPFGGRSDLLSKVKQAYSDITKGQLTPENRNFLFKLANTLEKRNAEKAQDKANFYSNNLVKDWKNSQNLKNINLNNETINSLLGTDTFKSVSEKLTNENVQKYANDHFKGDFIKAYNFLKNRLKRTP